MDCPQCACGCRIIPTEYLEKMDGRIKSFKIDDRPELLNMVNSFILIGTSEENGILGPDCFDAMCEAIKTAQSQADTYNEDNIEDSQTETNEEERNALYYIEEKWKTLIKNGHFQNMYAAYVMYYYYLTGSAAARTTKDGDVSTSRTSGSNEGLGSENIELNDSSKKANIQLNLAQNYSTIFKRTFWDSKKAEYNCDRSLDDCGECENSSSTGLQVDPKRKRTKIKTVII